MCVCVLQSCQPLNAQLELRVILVVGACELEGKSKCVCHTRDVCELAGLDSVNVCVCVCVCV